MSTHFFRSLSIALTCLLTMGHALAFMGEDISTDLYKTVHENADSLSLALSKKALTGSAEKLNEACSKAVSGADTPPPFRSGKDFTLESMQGIARWEIRALSEHLSPEYLRSWTSAPAINKLMECVKNEWAKIASDSVQTQQFVSDIATTGIYSDGSLDNSDFDLMSDIESINAVVFMKEIRYPWVAMDSGKKFFSLNAKPGYSDLGFLGSEAHAPRSSVATSLLPPPAGTPSAAPGPGSPGSPTSTWSASGATTPTEYTAASEYCATGGLLLDEATAAAIASSTTSAPIVTSGTATPSGSSGATYSMSGITWSGGRYRLPSAYTPSPRARSATKFDAFPCTGFFCVKIEYVSARGSGGATGYTTSIEKLLSYHREISQKFANSSGLMPTKMTNNFGELPFQNMKLKDMLKFEVKILKSPVPFRKIDPAQSPDPSTTPDEDKQMLENKRAVFAAWGFKDLERVNDLYAESGKKTQQISTLAGLTTASVAEKTSETPASQNGSTSSKTDAYEALLQELTKGYDEGFNSEIRSLGTFSIALDDQLKRFSELVKALNNIKPT